MFESMQMRKKAKNKMIKNRVRWFQHLDDMNLMTRPVGCKNKIQTRFRSKFEIIF